MLHYLSCPGMFSPYHVLSRMHWLCSAPLQLFRRFLGFFLFHSSSHPPLVSLLFHCHDGTRRTAMLSLAKRIRETVTPARRTSAFLTRGVLTPAEFVEAGEQLVFKCPTWTWWEGRPSRKISRCSFFFSCVSTTMASVDWSVSCFWLVNEYRYVFFFQCPRVYVTDSGF